MAPKKADKFAPKVEEKKKEVKKEMSPEMKELKEKEKALVKVSAPDRTAKDKAEEEIQAKLSVLKEKNDKLNSQIAEKSTGKEEHMKMKNEIRSKLDEYSEKINKLEERRSAIQGGIKEKQQAGREQRNELNAMKKKLGYDDVTSINAKIREIEMHMQHESISLKKEKELMQQIKELKASKPLVNKYAKMGDSVGQVDVSSMRDNIDDIKKELTEVREAKKLQQQAFEKLKEARQKVMGDVPELFTQREAISAQMRELYAKRNEIRDAFNTENKGYNNYLWEVRKLRGERIGIERAERQKEWDANNKGVEEADTAADVPFFNELQYLDIMKKHVASLKPKESEEEKKEEAKIDHVIKGEVLVAKGAREEEFFFAPTKKKQLKKKGASGKPKTLQHDMKTVSFFAEYKVSTPTDVSMLDKTLADIDARIAEYKAKQEKKIADIKRKAELKAAGKEDPEEAKEEKEEAKEEKA